MADNAVSRRLVTKRRLILFVVKYSGFIITKQVTAEAIEGFHSSSNNHEHQYTNLEAGALFWAKLEFKN
jgi:hypothetical protein